MDNKVKGYVERVTEPAGQEERGKDWGLAIGVGEQDRESRTGIQTDS
jgi:hypothetical protein